MFLRFTEIITSLLLCLANSTMLNSRYIGIWCWKINFELSFVAECVFLPLVEVACYMTCSELFDGCGGSSHNRSVATHKHMLIRSRHTRGCLLVMRVLLLVGGNWSPEKKKHHAQGGGVYTQSSAQISRIHCCTSIFSSPGRLVSNGNSTTPKYSQAVYLSSTTQAALWHWTFFYLGGMERG